MSDSSLTIFIIKLLLKEPRRKEKKVKKEWKNTWDGEDEEEKMNCDSPRSDEENSNSDDDNEDEDEDVVRRPKKSRKPVADSSESESDLDDLNVEDVDKVMRLLPDNPTGLLDFANAVQGILLLLVLKQHLKNQYGFSDRYYTHNFHSVQCTSKNVRYSVITITQSFFHPTAKFRNTLQQSQPRCTIRQ